MSISLNEHNLEMSDDVDIYDDLPDLNLGSISKVDEEKESYKKQLDEKEADLHKTKERIAHLEKENKILEKNISSLYQTAVNEIKRKDLLIEELRRDKESIIFRRKGRQNDIKSASATSSALDSNFHSVSSLADKHLLTSVESSNSMVSSPLKKKSLATSSKVESSDISSDHKSYTECFSSSLLLKPVLDGNTNSCSRVSDVSVNVSQTNTQISEITSLGKTSEFQYSEVSDKISSDSSLTLSNIPHQSGSKEHTRGTVLSKRAKQPFSSDERRERREDNYSDKYYSRSRHRSSYNSHRTLKLSHERNRNDRSWDRNHDRKYCTDSYEDIDFQEQKSRTGSSFEARRNRPLHSRRSPSPSEHSRRYSYRRHSNSKVRTLSDNMRVAAHLKSKYSKAMRERSVSRTPIKQQKLQNKSKFESSSKPVEDVQRKENVSKNLGKPYQTYKNENAKIEEGKEIVSVGVKVKMDDRKSSNSAQNNRCNGNVCRSESFQTQCEVELTCNKDNSCEKLPLQQLKTPPSKNLIPLKISPSFEDPAIVKGKNFSFCVFNEQCDFKRPKRKRSVKLLVSDIKDLGVTVSSEKNISDSSNDNNCKSGVTTKQNNDSCVQGNKDILEQSAFSNKTGIVNFKKQGTLNHCKDERHKNITLEENLLETSESNQDKIHCSDIETLNSQKLSDVDVLHNKGINKKRKLDNICENLKAHLEKEHVTSLDECVSAGNTIALPNIDKQGNVKANEQANTLNNISDFSMTDSDTIKSIEPPKRIIISKRRRKVCNLEDNVVHVIAQVKSRLS